MALNLVSCYCEEINISTLFHAPTEYGSGPVREVNDKN